MLTFFLNPLDSGSQSVLHRYGFLCPPRSCSYWFCSPPPPPFPPSLHISPFQPPFLKLLVTVPFPWLRHLDTYILLCFCYYNYFCLKRRAFPKPSCSHLDNITDTEKYIVIPLPRDSLMKTKLALLLQGASASD